MTFNGPINGVTSGGGTGASYIYVVAIRVLLPPVGSNALLSDPTQGPIPVVGTGSQTGMFAGLPTHYVLYTGLSPDFYTVYYFPLQTPTTTDPEPLNLLAPIQVGDVIAGSGIDPTSGGTAATNGNQLGFSIDTGYLNQYTGTAKIQTIQFNIFSMNVPALTATEVNERVMDAIGDQNSVNDGTFSNPIEVSLLTGGTYTDQTSGVTERALDTFPAGSNLPYIDMTGWSLTVTTP
jgi:hypothetical protein